MHQTSTTRHCLPHQRVKTGYSDEKAIALIIRAQIIQNHIHTFEAQFSTRVFRSQCLLIILVTIYATVFSNSLCKEGNREDVAGDPPQQHTFRHIAKNHWCETISSMSMNTKKVQTRKKQKSSIVKTAKDDLSLKLQHHAQFLISLTLFNSAIITRSPN